MVNVIQLIDSLAVGGAERVSVNLANALSAAGAVSSHCSTRAAGPLEVFLHDDVPRYCLHKRGFLDVAAFSTLVGILRAGRVQVIHAHSSSVIWACLAKLVTGCRVVWHDHYGNAEQLEKRASLALRFCAPLIDHAIVVNQLLQRYAVDSLGIPASRVTYLANYPDLQLGDALLAPLPGTAGKRVVMVANLRPQKDHPSLIRAFTALAQAADWHLLLVGLDFADDYSRQVHRLVDEVGGGRVHLLGARTDVARILEESTIGVLSSRSEGLPVALLEYGLVGLPIVATRVGQVEEVVGETAKLVPPGDEGALRSALSELVTQPECREAVADAFARRVREHYSRDVAIERLLDIYTAVSGRGKLGSWSGARTSRSGRR